MAAGELGLLDPFCGVLRTTVSQILLLPTKYTEMEHFGRGKLEGERRVELSPMIAQRVYVYPVCIPTWTTTEPCICRSSQEQECGLFPHVARTVTHAVKFYRCCVLGQEVGRVRTV